ncbi:MAG: tetratricopeptide repeat protein [Acidimicrobiia bacterium]
MGYGSLLEPSDRHADAEQILRESIDLYAELEAEGADRAILLYGYPAALINLSVEIQAQGRDPEQVTELNQRALEIARRIDDRAGVAVALGNLAESAAEAGEIDEARRRFAEALEASQALHSTQRLVDFNWLMGFFELAAGFPDRARTAFEQALAHAEGAGLAELAAATRAYLAICDADVGESDSRDRFAAHVSEVFENPDLRSFVSLRQTMLVLRSGLDASAGDLQRAGRVLGATQAIEEAGTVLGWALQGRRDRVLEEVRANLGHAAAEAALAAGRELDDQAVTQLIVERN